MLLKNIEKILAERSCNKETQGCTLKNDKKEKNNSADSESGNEGDYVACEFDIEINSGESNNLEQIVEQEPTEDRMHIFDDMFDLSRSPLIVDI